MKKTTKAFLKLLWSILRQGGYIVFLSVSLWLLAPKFTSLSLTWYEWCFSLCLANLVFQFIVKGK